MLQQINEHEIIRRAQNGDEEAEDVVRETFWRTWRSLSRYHNCDFDFEPTDSDSDIENMVEEKEVKKDLENAIHQLPPPYRAVIALGFQGGLEYKEIAQIMKMPINTIKTHLYRAK
jgi:RNA polymerase sigma-70 factor (ECF subfamily)